MIEGISRVGRFDVGQEDPIWFQSDRGHEFQPPSGPKMEFDPGFFMIAFNPTKFVFFDGQTVDYNLEKGRSACMFCWSRKNIDVEPDELLQVADIEMPYGYIDYEDVFHNWLKDDDKYDPQVKWGSVCTSCLEDIWSAYSELGYSTEALAHLI